MPKIVLTERDQEARIPSGLLDVRAYLAPATVLVRPVAVDAAGAVVPSPGATPPPGVAIVGADRVHGTTVRVEAAGGYPAGSVVTLVLTVGAYAVQVGPVPTAGLAGKDVVALAAVDGEIAVRVVVGDDDVVPLSPLGEAARAATADALGTSRVDAPSRFAPAIVVDGSASFRAIDRDAVGRLLDVLVGVASVAAAPDVALAISGTTVARGGTRDLAGLPATTLGMLDAAPRSSGARLAAAGLLSAPSEGHGVAWIVTDDVPWDRAAIAAAAAASGTTAHLVVVADAATVPTDEVVGVPVTVVDAAALHRPSFGLDDDATLPRLARSLLRGTDPTTRGAAG